MHSQLALTEHASLILAPLVLLDPVAELVAHHFCLALLAASSQTENDNLAELCIGMHSKALIRLRELEVIKWHVVQCNFLTSNSHYLGGAL